MLKEKTFLQNQFSSSMHGKNIVSKKKSVDSRGRDVLLRKELTLNGKIISLFENTLVEEAPSSYGYGENFFELGFVLQV